MFDPKIMLIMLAIALILFGTKRLRHIGPDLGAALKGFKHAVNEGEPDTEVKQVGEDAVTPPPRGLG